MAIKTGFSYQNPEKLVARYIGTSYDTVKLVADNIGSVATVSDNIDNVNLVAGDIAHVIVVSENIDSVTAIVGDLDNINLVGDNITDVNTVATNIDEVVAVSANIDDVVFVADNFEDVMLDIETLKTDVNTLNGEMDAVEIDVSNLSNSVIGLANDLTSLDSRVGDVETDLTSAESDIINNANDISSLDTRVTDAESDITDNTTAISNLGTLASVDDAPSDGKQYARKDAGWTEVEASGGVTLPIGTGMLWAGPIETVPFDGTWAMHDVTTVYPLADYAELVALNPDPDLLFSPVEIKSTEMSYHANGGYGENIKYWNDQEYFTKPFFNGSKDAIDIHTTSFGNTSIGYVLGSSTFYITPGISVDDGNGTGGSSSAVVRTSPFEIKGAKLYDGTVCNGFVSVAGRDNSFTNDYSFSIKRTDLFANDMSDWVNDTTLETRRNEYNSLNSLDGNAKIHNTYFFEDGFYLVYAVNSNTNIQISKFSYDFTGGTRKFLTSFGDRNYDINDTYSSDFDRYFNIGNETENFYQFDTATSDIYINGTYATTQFFEYSHATTIDPANLNFSVIEQNGKILVITSAEYVFDGTQLPLAQGISYFDGEVWRSIIIPLPTGITDAEEYSMNIVKFDFETGVVVAAMGNPYGAGSANYWDTAVLNLVVSRDFGSTWSDDTGISNGGNGEVPNPVTQKMDLNNINSFNRLGINKSTTTWKYQNCLSSKLSAFKSSNNLVVTTNNYVAYCEGITFVPNTATYESSKVGSNKLNMVYRVL